jgi:hypothetical protein
MKALLRVCTGSDKKRDGHADLILRVCFFSTDKACHIGAAGLLRYLLDLSLAPQYAYMVLVFLPATAFLIVTHDVSPGFSAPLRAETVRICHVPAL